VEVRARLKIKGAKIKRMAKRVLVTGAAGFIGSRIIRFLSNKPDIYDTIGVDTFDLVIDESTGRRTYGSFRNVDDCDTVVLPIDVRTEEFIRLLASYKPEIIFHLAADSSTLAKSYKDTLVSNVMPFRMLLSYADKTGCRLVYASSASVYGSIPKGVSAREDNKILTPLNIYSYSKRQMEILARQSQYSVGLRYFNVYGSGEEHKGTTASVAMQIFQSYKRGERLPMFHDSGITYRDFVYIDDVVDITVKSIGFNPGVYNVATGSARSFQEIYDLVASHIPVGHCSYKQNDCTEQYQYWTEGSIEKLVSQLGEYKPLTIEEGIYKMATSFSLC